MYRITEYIIVKSFFIFFQIKFSLNNNEGSTTIKEFCFHFHFGILIEFDKIYLSIEKDVFFILINQGYPNENKTKVNNNIF